LFPYEDCQIEYENLQYRDDAPCDQICTSVSDGEDDCGSLFVGDFENGMKRVNARRLYLLGKRLHELLDLQIGTTVVNNRLLLRRAVATFASFTIDDDFGEGSPNAVKAAEDAMSYLNKHVLAFPNMEISKGWKDLIEQQLARFESALEIDIDALPIFLLEEKRGLNPKTLLSAVVKLIPKAVTPYLSAFAMANLQDATASLVFDHFTSSGFQTMRAVEDVARYYYELITGIPVVTVDPANGERSYFTLGQIAWKLDHDVLAKLPPTRSPTRHLKFVVPMLATLCEIYRNPLSHPEIVKLDEDEAFDVFIKGIDVISTMVRDVKMGGKHFDKLRDDYTAFDLPHDPEWR
jgi:hypothetical protein